MNPKMPIPTFSPTENGYLDVSRAGTLSSSPRLVTHWYTCSLQSPHRLTTLQSTMAQCALFPQDPIIHSKIVPTGKQRMQIASAPQLPIGLFFPPVVRPRTPAPPHGSPQCPRQIGPGRKERLSTNCPTVTSGVRVYREKYFQKCWS